MKSIDYIRKFTGLENVRESKNLTSPEESPLPIKKQDEMMSLVYAPDPITGIPSNDIAMMLKNRDNPDVQRYIQQRLQVARESYKGAENPDDALTAIRAYKEDVVAYAKRMKEEFSPAEKFAGESE